MGVQFGSGLTTRIMYWTAFKALLASKVGAVGVVQYVQDSTTYSIWFYDGPEVISTTIWLGTIPYTTEADYSQVQNDLDKTDFENNYKTNCNQRISRVDAWGNPVSDPIEFAASFGLLPGVTTGRITGYIGTSATTAVAIRATSYSPQGSNGQRSIASSSANDTAAGTGMRKVKVTYLTEGMVEKTETITLNGTTGVNTVATDMAFLQKMEAVEVGSGGGNAGTISIYQQINKGGSVWGSISVGDNQTYWAHHYVPTGKTCHLLNLSVGSTAVGGWATVMRTGNPTVSTEPQRSIAGTYPHPTLGIADHSFRIPLSITGPDLVWLVDRPSAATASTAFGTFEYVEF